MPSTPYCMPLPSAQFAGASQCGALLLFYAVLFLAGRMLFAKHLAVAAGLAVAVAVMPWGCRWAVLASTLPVPASPRRAHKGRYRRASKEDETQLNSYDPKRADGTGKPHSARLGARPCPSADAMLDASGEEEGRRLEEGSVPATGLPLGSEATLAGGSASSRVKLEAVGEAVGLAVSSAGSAAGSLAAKAAPQMGLTEADVRRIQADCSADDCTAPIGRIQVEGWSEADVCRFFETGGTEEPAPKTRAPAATAEGVFDAEV